MPDEFPAVTWPSGPVSEGSAASFSSVVSRRGCSSTLTVTVSPRPAGTVTGTISSAKRPSSVAATARMFEWYDQSSDSSRVMPHSRAVFSPTVMSMFMLGASGESGWLGGHEPLDAAEGEGRLLEEERGAGHGLDPAGDDDVGHARADVGRRLLHRHHPGGALALHRAARRVGRQAQRVGHVAGGAAAALEDLAEDQVVDVVGSSPAAR